jgi:hypothetical protein
MVDSLGTEFWLNIEWEAIRGGTGVHFLFGYFVDKAWIFVDANSNLSHQGERLYTGDFAATLRHALPSAVGAPEGQRMTIKGLENLKPTT